MNGPGICLAHFIITFGVRTLKVNVKQCDLYVCAWCMSSEKLIYYNGY